MGDLFVYIIVGLRRPCITVEDRLEQCLFLGGVKDLLNGAKLGEGLVTFQIYKSIIHLNVKVDATSKDQVAFILSQVVRIRGVTQLELHTLVHTVSLLLVGCLRLIHFSSFELLTDVIGSC